MHWIQGLRYGDREHPPAPGTLIDLGEDGTIVVEVDGEVRRFWHHDPLLVASRAAAAGNEVELQARWGMLGIRHDAGISLICIARPNAHSTCPLRPPQGDILEMLESAGGFTAAISR